MLFTLPSTKISVVLEILFSAILFIVYRFPLYGFNQPNVIILIIFEISLFSLVFIERTVLGEGNPLATFKRLGVTSLVSNIIWLFVLCLGFLFSLPLYQYKLDSFLYLGFFFVLSFRLMIFISAFFKNLLKKIIMTILQPVFLLCILDSPISILKISSYVVPIFGGMMIVTSSIAFLMIVDRSSMKFLDVGTLDLFRAFLSAWSTNYPDALEQIMEKRSASYTIETNTLIFNSVNMKLALIIPEVHPGPFYPAGSSNLPSHIQKWFLSKGFSPLVFHGVSGHEFNLPSMSEVKKFISNFDKLSVISSGKTCSAPMITKLGEATASCIAFGNDAIIMLTSSPYGMEDLPLDIKEKIESLATNLGYSHVIVIDTHNSQGSHISEEIYNCFVKATEKSLSDLKSMSQNTFKVGYAHSSDFNLKLGNDIGAAGLGTIVIEVEGKKYSIVSVDANNAVSGLREELMKNLNNSQAPILEICTSDTHITAGKTPDPKGYIALGEKTDVNELSKATRLLIDASVERLTSATFNVKQVNTPVKIVGTKLLEDFSKVIDVSFSIMKKASIFLFLLSAFVIILTGLL